MILVTANLGRGVSDPKFRANVNKIKAACPTAVVAFQELDEADTPDEHTIVGNVFHAHARAAWRRNNPILVPPGWRLTATHVIKACEGLEHVTPARFLVEAVIARDGRLVSVMNLHWPRNVPEAAERRQACTETLRAAIKKRASQGRTVFWVGDTNTHGAFPKLHGREVRVVDDGIDRIGYVEGLTGVDVVGTGSVDLTIDGHDAQWARFKMTPPPAA